MNNPTAAALIIGNELLSGRVQDINVAYIAKRLGDSGIKLVTAHIVPDIVSTISDSVRKLKNSHDYVFTTGGIGPTHDDITSAAIADSLGITLELNPIALAAIKQFFIRTKQQFNESAEKMAYIPRGCSLISNHISGSPGFYIENIYVMAGVPIIMQSMLEEVVPKLVHGSNILSKSINLAVAENMIAAELADLQNKYRIVEMGSYPCKSENTCYVSLVLSSSDHNMLELAFQELYNRFHKFEIKQKLDV